MSLSSAHAAQFYREVAKLGELWTLEDASGIPAPLNSEGQRSMPFWSSHKRVDKIIASVPAYNQFSPKQIVWTEFANKWVPGLTKDGLLVGVNWSGPTATGYDILPAELKENVEYEMGNL